ncbi:Glycosyltransferase involved in cell wall bisynthesis [Arsukibacterium tuosuense]|uniref:Glycosyltransferase involved in cell wall bisynthesis n=1 Tax=Arsukibacterium tuosuense TaxID=1323745 RepID=A0A285IUG0_9GAMM|nr:glycosyltransferase family 4 protein [Arsukibacterium tuosuense]SNY51614.1 Glycosyltransferase involved in cell wall bisynthesis [Arsukibacterium tuosuense]
MIDANNNGAVPKPLAVTLVGPVPPPAGGMAMQTAQLLRLLTDTNQLNVKLIAVNPPYQPHWVANIPVLRALFRLLPYFWQLHKACKHSDVIHLMANSGWAWHLFAAPAIWIAHWHKVPVIVNYRGGLAADFLARQRRWVLPSLRRASAIVTPSAFLQGVFAHYQLKCQIIPNIVDTAIFHGTLKASLATAPHLVVTRNLEAIYDIATAIRAFAIISKQLPQARLSIAGSGPERPALVALVQQLQLDSQVTFCGKLDRPQMAELYASADIMLNPSTADNMPNSLLEAMAASVLVVSTDVGGIPYMVEHQRDALLVAAAAPEQMAAAVLTLVARPELAKQLAAHAQAKVTQYQPAQVLPGWLALYEHFRCANA